MKVHIQILLGLLFAIALYSQRAQARPVAYKDTTSLMLRSGPAWTESMAHQTVSRWLSLGARYSSFRFVPEEFGERRIWTAEAHQLLTRLNLERSQMNFYLGEGVGIQEGGGRNSDSEFVGVLSAEGDWESREYYSSLRYEHFLSSDDEDLGLGVMRFGFAPYLSGFEGLHTWVLLEVQYRSWQREIKPLPFLRFFYQNVLFEIGSSLDGEWAFNWVTEF